MMLILPQTPSLVSEGLEGYISMSVPAPPEGFGYGVSLYANAWPLLEKPLRGFQIGLASIWIVPDNRKVEYPLLPHGTVARDNWPERGPSYRDVFQTIEGGLGFWGDTRFGDPTEKFRMNGTPDGYNREISTPGWGFGGSGQNLDALAPDQMGIAQLSSHILVPPDGFTFKKGTVDQLLGYAWMALPLTLPKSSPVATGDQSWTLFLNTKGFKGPVAFYTPVTWTRISQGYPPAVGRGLDTLSGLVTGGAIEVNTVPRFTDGEFAKIPRLQFPADKDGRTVLIHKLTHYSKGALYDQVSAWLNGGVAASGRFDEKGMSVPVCKANPLSLDQAHQHIKGFDAHVKTAAFDRNTFGLQWDTSALEPWHGAVMRGSFPQYFRQDGKQVSVAASPPSDLLSASFPEAESGFVYKSPEGPDDVWHRPGPKAGPFQARLSDGSVVTYYWYRFIDQPALQDAGLTVWEKARLQAVAEKIQRNWTPNRTYMPSPDRGTLASLDPALLVRPPKGLEVGFVPIAVRQEEVGKSVSR